MQVTSMVPSSATVRMMLFWRSTQRRGILRRCQEYVPTQPRTSRAVVVLMLFTLAGFSGCSRQSQNSAVNEDRTQTGASPAVPVTPAATREDKNAVCALMPLGDVAKILAPALALQRPGPGAPAMRADYSMCHYSFPGEPRVGAGIELTDFQSTALAADAFRAQREMNAKRADVIRELADLGGYGDAAFVADEPGVYSAAVSIRTGTFILRTVVGVDEQPFSFRLPLAEGLAKEVLRRRR